MGAAAVAAAVTMLWPSGPGPTESQQNLEDVSKSAQNLSVTVSKLRLTKTESYILSMSSAPWTRDPFFPRPLDLGPRGGAKGAGAVFNYTGFIQVEGRSLAVINGTEYQTGEQLESGGFAVVEITPEQVVLEDVARKNRIVVPYVDASFFTQD